MPVDILLITPPFTQLNTPYPATAYLKGFLNTKHITSFQSDLGIEVILELFTQNNLSVVFNRIAEKKETLSASSARMLTLRNRYLTTIEPVIRFLQGQQPTLAHRMVDDQFLPRAARFDQLDDMQWAFGTMGLQDKAKHYATLYLEDLADLIADGLDAHFGFSRYAEQLGRSAYHFDELHASLQQVPTYIDELTIRRLSILIDTYQPRLLALSVPFPGNLYSAFRCAQWVKQHHPTIQIAMGGGFPNTELRSLQEKRVFDYFDFVTLDDGEVPIEHLIEYINGKRDKHLLKRTFLREAGNVVYCNGSLQRDYKQHEIGTPDYSDLLLDQYISVIEIVNPMHRLWNDGRWNKLTLAHGCYWGKCTFCDISLDYIKNYEPLTASLICDRMQTMIETTGETGFHFVDEAAPPSLMRALAIEILSRKMVVSWWTNIRFEKSFTKDLCMLLKASGCIGVSGGLEVASDRLLALIEKGVTVAQVAVVMQHFTEAGIMVHAYLMYGYPTQTALETIDSLEMVRQLFQCGILRSGFWHRFALTVHSPVGKNPEKYQIDIDPTSTGPFANNDLRYHDRNGTNHDAFSFGLKKSLLNYMHQIGLDQPLHTWFAHKVPATSIAPDYIRHVLQSQAIHNHKPSAKVIWVGHIPEISFHTKSKKGKQGEVAHLLFHHAQYTEEMVLPKDQGIWLVQLLETLSQQAHGSMTFAEVQQRFEDAALGDFDLCWYNKPLHLLWKVGLWVVN